MVTVKGKVTWTDILRPTKGDAETLKKKYNFHPIILDEILHPSARSRVEKYNNYLFLTYHLPFYDPILKTARRAEVDFLITKKTVITVHYEQLEPLEVFNRSISNSIHFKNLAFNDTAKLTYYIVQEIIQFSMRQLKPIEESISYITQEIFRNKENEMLEIISYTKRNALDFQIISRPQEILLNSLAEVGVNFWGDNAQIYLSDLIGDYSKVMQHLDNNRQVIEALETTNSQLFNSKMSAVMQKVSILAFLTFPLVIILQAFSINSVSAFFGDNPINVLFGIGLAVVITTITIIIFKKLKWL